MARRPRGSSGRAGAVGSQSWARGRILIFRKIYLYVFFAKSTHGKTPTLYLPWSYPGATSHTRPTPRLPQRKTRRPEVVVEGGQREKSRGKKRERRKMRQKEQNGKTPTLELSSGGQRPDRARARVVRFPIPPTPSLPREVRDIGEIEAKDGLPSADRNNKATLLLTGPFRTAKSSAKDLTPLVLKLQYAKYRGPLRGPRRNRLLRH